LIDTYTTFPRFLQGEVQHCENGHVFRMCGTPLEEGEECPRCKADDEIAQRVLVRDATKIAKRLLKYRN
jgi:hypothetical protein